MQWLMCFTLVNCSLSRHPIQPAISLTRIHCFFSFENDNGTRWELPSLKLTASLPLKNSLGPKRKGSSPKHPFFRGELLVLGSVCTSCCQIMIISHRVVFAGNISSTYSITNCMFVYLDPKLNCLVLHSVHHKVLHVYILWYPWYHGICHHYIIYIYHKICHLTSWS